MVLEIINTSIHEANVPEVLKEALLQPLLKKPGLDLVFPNYQPVSNLTFVSKLIERVICKQLTEYTESTGMTEHLQSAYKANNSTETALGQGGHTTGHQSQRSHLPSSP